MVARRRSSGPKTDISDESWIRTAGVWLLVAIASIAFSGYVAVRWMERQILDTDSWVSLVGPLPEQPVVSDALGRHIGQQVYDEADVEQRISDALPPRAAFLAGPLNDQFRNVTVRASQKVVASDGFQTIWEGANRAAMNRLLAKARGETPPLQAKVQERFNVDVSGAGGALRAGLGKASTAIPALQPASQKTLAVSTDLKTSAAKVHQTIRLVDTLNAVLPLVALAATLTALAISRRRRNTFLTAATAAVVLLLGELIALKWLRGYVLEQVRQGENVPAISYIFDTLSGGLRNVILVALAILAVLMIMALLAGSAAFIEKFRSVTALDRLPDTRFGRWWQGVRVWLRTHRLAVWIGIAVAVLIGLAARAQVDAQALANAILLTISLAAAVQLLAARDSELSRLKSKA